MPTQPPESNMGGVGAARGAGAEVFSCSQSELFLFTKDLHGMTKEETVDLRWNLQTLPGPGEPVYNGV